VALCDCGSLAGASVVVNGSGRLVILGRAFPGICD